MNESKGVVGVLVLAGVLLSAHAAESSDFSALSTPELKKQVEAGEARMAAAFGKHKSVMVNGEIKDPGEHVILLSGMAVPNDGNFYGFGIHMENACLMVRNPKGRVLAGFYMDENLFYLGEGRAKNAFGAAVPCSIYGAFDELPAEIRAAVKKAYGDVHPLKVELDRRLEAERKTAEATRQATRQAAEATRLKRDERVRQIDERLNELTRQRAQLGGTAPIPAIHQEEEALDREKHMLINGLSPEQEQMHQAARKKEEQAERAALISLRINLERASSSFAETDGRCKSARARLREATRSQSMGRGTTDEEINRAFQEEISACSELGPLSAKKIELENELRRMGETVDESTTTGATPTPATGAHSANSIMPSVGSSMPPRPVATRSPAEEALDRGDFEAAYAAYAPRAETGDSDAQVRLGVMYYDALGRKQDFELAERWFRKAAQRGSAEANYRLALLFSEGRKGAPWDLGAAHRFLRESAPIYPEAAYKLGRFYWDGIGVPEDRIKAREWIEKAAAKGDSSAIDWISSHK